ncbi:MAG TPA: adenylate/guanylate cyclase domain-containing protein [Gemmataceae bacterium]|nr:adenylate/guanylate cyclase domain-containing protein [Gemmataceae bacterium]
MSTPLELRIYENEKLVYSQKLTETIELGRQSKDEAEPFYLKKEPSGSRLIVARHDELTISRRSLLIELIADGKVRLTNLSTTRGLQVPNVGSLGHEDFRVASPPLGLSLGKLAVRIEAVETEELAIHGLAEATVRPGMSCRPSLRFDTLGMGAGEDNSKAFIKWLHAALDVFQSAASSADFLDKAAAAAAELVSLDSAQILLRGTDDQFSQATQSSTASSSKTDGQPSRRILTRLLQEKRTFWEMPDASAPKARSLAGIKVVVAAPILNRHGEVIGVLYGNRRGDSPMAAFGPITELEASLVELLARGVAAGLARLEQERAELEARVRFEQFFTPQLARQLEANPDLLQGRDAEVTLLFCDIRGFSRISERLGPARTVAWISDTMATLSECVRARQGVLVDYIGDELIAMWGAPEAQPGHARLACSAALDMLAQVPKLNARWQEQLQEKMGLGIGVNTGVARVGNTGSPHKFKYGPLGNTVNLASRVQGATKYLKSPLLITGATRERLDDSFHPRRLGRVRVINIVEPVELYELADPSRPGWSEARTQYEKALELFENGMFTQAALILGELRARQPEDGPALVLLYRSVYHLVEEHSESSSIWELPGK